MCSRPCAPCTPGIAVAPCACVTGGGRIAVPRLWHVRTWGGGGWCVDADGLPPPPCGGSGAPAQCHCTSAPRLRHFSGGGGGGGLVPPLGGCVASSRGISGHHHIRHASPPRSSDAGGCCGPLPWFVALQHCHGPQRHNPVPSAINKLLRAQPRYRSRGCRAAHRGPCFHCGSCSVQCVCPVCCSSLHTLGMSALISHAGARCGLGHKRRPKKSLG